MISGDDQLPLGFAGEESPDSGKAPVAAPGFRPFAPPGPIVTGPGVEPPKIDAMYGRYFLEYASYVILERAVPHLYDGVKPVVRRILHCMNEMEDGRYNKVANIIGRCMQYHPHGDASIGDALVQLGQKDLLIDMQGNWGNILTGDSAAAPRYIEARLTRFALDVVFSPKVTIWSLSYDGRNKEPVTLPAKFPLLLAQGVEGIAVGLSCRILPHNFVEILDAAIEVLKGKTPVLLPDFPQGGIMDASAYNDGDIGGKVRIRARIEVEKKKLLKITEVPFGTTTGSLIESIIAANEKGKINIAKVEDNTAEKVEILVHLPAGTEPETAIMGLYAFTDCENPVTVSTVVIENDKPVFLTTSELLKRSVNQTREILRMELEVRLGELREKWHFASLEKIFIEKRIYRRIEESETWEAVIATIDKGLDPYKKLFEREVTRDDIVRLTEIRIKRISKFNTFEADRHINDLENEITTTKDHLANLTRFAIDWFKELKKKYGKGRERRTEIASFDKVVAAAVAVANETLYVNMKDGFAGYGLKKEGEPLCKCSTLDDLISFHRDGTMKVTKVAEKVFLGASPLHVSIFQKDAPVTYYMIYRDNEREKVFAKKFQAEGVTRDKVYELTKEPKSTRVLWFYASDNPAFQPKVTLVHREQPRIAKTVDFDFGTIEIQGRSSTGLIVTEYAVDRVRFAPS